MGCTGEDSAAGVSFSRWPRPTSLRLSASHCTDDVPPLSLQLGGGHRISGPVIACAPHLLLQQPPRQAPGPCVRTYTGVKAHILYVCNGSRSSARVCRRLTGAMKEGWENKVNKPCHWDLSSSSRWGEDLDLALSKKRGEKVKTEEHSNFNLHNQSKV